ncbi:hypothetical protein SRHO_G00220820 [Serrasalmus rhombeus]
MLCAPGEKDHFRGLPLSLLGSLKIVRSHFWPYHILFNKTALQHGRHSALPQPQVEERGKLCEVTGAGFLWAIRAS